MLYHFLLVTIVLSGPALVRGAESALDIVRKSVLVDEANEERMNAYTFLERSDERKLDSDGAMRSTGSKTYETVFLYGRPFRRVVKRNDKPLSPGDQKKEQERFDNEVEKRRNESEKQRKHAVEEEEKRRKETRRFMSEIAEVYDFRIAGEEQLSGHDCWVIVAEPKRGYEGRTSEAKTLTKMHGRVWIDKAGYHWVKVQAEVTDTVSWGLFLARMSAGSRLDFEETRINDEVWLPQRLLVHLNARLLFKKFDAEYESVWSNYHKFTTESKIVAGAESN